MKSNFYRQSLDSRVRLITVLMALMLVCFNLYAGQASIGDSISKYNGSDAITEQNDGNQVRQQSTRQDTQTPELTLIDLHGNVQRLSALKGKVVFINFWATWCPPCREEMPTIEKLHAHFKSNKDIVFLLVDIDGRLETSARFLEKHGYDLPVYKVQGGIAKQFLGDAIPATIILDRLGSVVARVEGANDYGTEEVFKGIEQLLKD